MSYVIYTFNLFLSSAFVTDKSILVTDAFHEKIYQIPLEQPNVIHGINAPIQGDLTGVLYNWLTERLIFGSDDTSEIWSVKLDGSNATMLSDISKYRNLL